MATPTKVMGSVGATPNSRLAGNRLRKMEPS
jgi:hypothetical protein